MMWRKSSDGLVVTGTAIVSSHASVGLAAFHARVVKPKISTLTLQALQRAGQNIAQDRGDRIGRAAHRAGVVEHSVTRYRGIRVLLTLNEQWRRGVGPPRGARRPASACLLEIKFP